MPEKAGMNVDAMMAWKTKAKKIKLKFHPTFECNAQIHILVGTRLFYLSAKQKTDGLIILTLGFKDPAPFQQFYGICIQP